MKRTLLKKKCNFSNNKRPYTRIDNLKLACVGAN